MASHMLFRSPEGEIVKVKVGFSWQAFFLERGEVRFDGPTEELLQRDDLLRPVFLTDTTT